MKIAILFPGYGNQHTGMGKNLCEEYAVARECFEKASEIAGIDFEKLCFAEPELAACVSAPNGEFCFSSGSSKLNKIPNAYLALHVLSHAIYCIFEEFGIKPSCLSGYDTGQYTAITVANGFSFSEGLILLRKYGDAYADLLRGGKYGLIKVNGLTSTKLPQYLDKRTAIAVYQSRTQHLVSGTKEGIMAVQDRLKNASGVVLYDIGLGLGLNSPLMQPVVAQFSPSLQQVSFNKLSMPVISNITGAWITEGNQMKEEVIKLITSPVKWDKVVNELAQADLIVGIGHKANLLDLVVEKYPEKPCIAVCKAEDVEKVQELYASWITAK